jgi:hypothetical protein
MDYTAAFLSANVNVIMRGIFQTIAVRDLAETWLGGQPSEIYIEWLAKVRATGK